MNVSMCENFVLLRRRRRWWSHCCLVTKLASLHHSCIQIVNSQPILPVLSVMLVLAERLVVWAVDDEKSATIEAHVNWHQCTDNQLTWKISHSVVRVCGESTVDFYAHLSQTSCQVCKQEWDSFHYEGSENIQFITRVFAVTLSSLEGCVSTRSLQNLCF